MNFFQHQDRARKQTRRLMFAFALAVLVIVLAMNMVMLVIFGRFSAPDQNWLSGSFWRGNATVVVWTSLITVGVIGLASLFRASQLRGGGATVATELGGVAVDGSTADPLRRRLLNVVEEMAIASGVPVPQVFVLEHEQGINAFAAGWSSADAAVAVTRGALETLSREELQGVIAHEFSHVFNGDMRLNIRLMGVLFGILVIAVVGRKLLSSMRYSFSSRRRNNAGAIVLIAVAVMIIGYIGLFFGRWIQAAVSRQREYLADASAVQFTRSPEGIAGALIKIGATVHGSRLLANTEEIGHMLFARGMASKLFATHPPLEDRIRRIEPSFSPEQFKEVAMTLRREQQRKSAEQEMQAERGSVESALPGGLTLDPGQLLDRIGEAGVTQALLAAALLQSVPQPLERAAHSDEWAAEVLLYLLLAEEPELRENQLLQIAQKRGSDSEQRVRELLGMTPRLASELRLPLMEMAFPSLRRRPERELLEMMRLVDDLVAIDGHVDVFEYVMAKLLNREIEQAFNPTGNVSRGRARLAELAPEISGLIGIVARLGHPGDSEAERNAIAAAMAVLGLEQQPAESGPWQQKLEHILARLGRLRPEARARLIEALLTCSRHDGEIRTSEYELLRLIAGMLDVPLPLAYARE